MEISPPPSGSLTAATIRAAIARHAGADKVPTRFKIIADTSDFFRVDYNDVVVLGERAFWIKGYEKEGRFGLDDEPKYWVRRAVDLASGATTSAGAMTRSSPPPAPPSWRSRRSCAAASWWWAGEGSPTARNSSSAPPRTISSTTPGITRCWWWSRPDKSTPSREHQ